MSRDTKLLIGLALLAYWLSRRYRASDLSTTEGLPPGAENLTAPHAMGLRPPTDAERAWMDQNAAVNPAMPMTEIGFQRINAQYVAQGQPPLSGTASDWVLFPDGTPGYIHGILPVTGP